MSTQQKATPGGIISGTLLPQDLLRAFATEVRRYYTNPTVRAACGTADEWAGALDMEDYGGVSREDAYEQVEYMLEHLQDALEQVAPAGHYFGAIEGDGACFGFWPINEEDVP